MHRTFNANQSTLFRANQRENADLDYTINWAGELDTATISSSDWSTEDSVTIANETNTTTTASCDLTGEPGRYRVVNQITDSNGNVDERIIELTILENSQDYSDYGLTWDYR